MKNYARPGANSATPTTPTPTPRVTSKCAFPNSPTRRPTEPVNPEHLVGGYTIYRYTEPAGRRVETWTPCCGRPVRTNLDSGPVWAVCCACRIAYDLHLESDVDGGWYAVFVVSEDQLVIAKHRSPPRRR